MNKLGETHNHTSGAQTTSFQIEVIGQKPTSSKGAVIYSQPCAMGWRFGYYYTKNTKSAGFYIDASKISDTIKEVTVNVSFSSPNYAVPSVSRRISLPPPSSQTLLVSRSREQVVAYPTVSFEVIPEFKDPPLPIEEIPTIPSSIQEPEDPHPTAELVVDDDPLVWLSHTPVMEKLVTPTNGTLPLGQSESDLEQTEKREAGLIEESIQCGDEPKADRASSSSESAVGSTENWVKQLAVEPIYPSEQVAVEAREERKPEEFSDAQNQKANMSPSQALAESLRSGVFIDTKFYAYSQRGRKGGARLPLPMFANSSILRASSLLLRYELEHTRAFHSCIAELDDNSITRNKDDAEYSYEYDSDLDEDENHADFSDPDDRSSSSIKTFGSEESTLPPRAHPIPNFRISGRTLLVKDYAFKTWQALIYYLYTGSIAFSNLKSERSTKLADADTPFPCSPKSMYRLADKFGLDELKELAFQSICTKITKDNIVDEVFCKFTSQYPLIQAKELEMLVRHKNSPEVISALPGKFHSIARGDLPHCADVLTNVFLELADGELPKSDPSSGAFVF